MSLNPLSFPSLPSQRAMHLPKPESPPDSPTSQIHISPSSTEGSTISEEEDDLAEREWQESLAQLALLFNLVLLPFAGKYFGRKFAYFIWAKWMEYRWPVDVVFSSKKTFEIAGLAEAALA